MTRTHTTFEDERAAPEQGNRDNRNRQGPRPRTQHEPRQLNRARSWRFTDWAMI